MVKLLALLALAAAATSTVDATSVPVKPFLTFDKQSLNIEGNVAGETVSVSLTEKPTDDVVVYLEAPNTRFDKCSLAFTPENFNQPQQLTVVGLPFVGTAPAPRKIPIKFTAFTEDCAAKHHNVSTELQTTRTPQGSGQCQITGDPHYKTFDNTAQYHYMGVGDYYLVKSDSLIIQARQGKCFGKASCIHALAVRYGGASFVIDASDPDPNTCVKTVTHLDGAIISRTRSGQVTTVNVSLNAGSSIKIDMYGSGDARFLNVYVNVANHLKGKVNGLCGRFDGLAANDFSTPDGQSFTTQEIIDQSNRDMFGQSPNFQQSPLFKYGESWRVPDNENLFKCRDNCPGLANVKPPLPVPVAECKIPTTVPTCDNRTTTGTLTSSSAVTSSSSSSVPATTTVPASSSSSTQAQSTSLSSSTQGQSSSASTSTQGQSTSASTSTQGQSTSASSSTQGQSTSAFTSTQDQSTSVFTSTQGQSTSASTSTQGQSSSASSSSAGSTTTTATTTSSALTTTTSRASTTTFTSNKPQPTYDHRRRRKHICPRPIIIIAIPPGFLRQVQLPRYRQEPRIPDFRPLPQPPRQDIEVAKRACTEKIARIDQCDEDIRRFVTACEADVEAQMNPDVAFEVHRDAYTDVCSKVVIDKAREPFPEVAQRAREALKKHCFGNQPCDRQCLQCSPRGCLECRDRNKFEVLAGRCVPRKVVRYNEKFFSQRPKYRALADSEIAPQGGEVGDNVDPMFNAKAVVETDSVQVAVSEDPVKAQEEEDKKKEAEEAAQAPQSSAMRLALSSIAGAAALALSIML